MPTFLLRTLFYWLLLLLGIQQVYAFNTSRHEIDWAQELQLSTQQQQAIQTLEEQYRKQHQQLHQNKERCRDTEQLKEKTAQLQQALFVDLQAVLNDEQRQKANQTIQQHHKRMQLRHAQEVAQTLNIPQQQRVELFADIEVIPFSYQWPLDLEQREQARQAFELLLNQHLTEEQQQQWHKKQQHASKKWHHSDAYYSLCMKPSRD